MAAQDLKPTEAGSPAPPGDAKRTLTRENVSKTVGNAAASAPAFLSALVKPKTSAALREKVMLEVTAINDCGYCKWGHSYLAVAQGVPLEEINQIFGYQDEALVAKDEADAAAILFAQHYAENMDEIDPESLENLSEYYSDAQVAEIIAYVRAITLGNLTGNTLDALLDKARDLRDRPAVIRVIRDLGDPTRRVSFLADARIAAGSTAMIAPRPIGRVVTGRRMKNRRARHLTRFMGARNVSLGYGLARSSQGDGSTQRWLLACGLADVVDAAAVAIASRRQARGRRAFRVAMALLPAAANLGTAAQLRRRGVVP